MPQEKEELKVRSDENIDLCVWLSSMCCVKGLSCHFFWLEMPQENRKLEGEEL